MGAPGYTCFCKNGHIVKTVGHHCIDDDAVKVCPFCKATKFITLIEWPDEDYGTNDMVPFEPIRQEWLSVNFEDFKGNMKVSVFDVSKIPEDQWRDETL